MSEPEKKEHPEEHFDDLSLDELLRGAREEIARVDAMMGAQDAPADEAVDAADAPPEAAEPPRPPVLQRNIWRRKITMTR